jgi:acetyltransferase-like isoleucine patch superfamily enzyme
MAKAMSILWQDTGNKVARKAILVGTQNITLGGKIVIQPEVMIRGDLSRSTASSGGSGSGNNTAISIGRYCFFSRGCCLRPPGRFYKGSVGTAFVLGSFFVLTSNLEQTFHSLTATNG